MRVLLCAVAIALVAVAPALASERHPTQNELEGEVMCPVCGTTVDQSDAPIAQNIKMFIRSEIAAGKTKSQIEDSLAGQFGEAVLASPPKRGFNLLAWLLPLIGLAVAVPIVGWLAWRWPRTREPVAASRSSSIPSSTGCVDRELTRFDAS